MAVNRAHLPQAGTAFMRDASGQAALERLAWRRQPEPDGAGAALGRCAGTQLNLPLLADVCDEFTISFEADTGSLWCFHRHRERPCYRQPVLDQISLIQRHLREVACPSVRSLIWGSELPGVFNLGGDLELFVRLIRAGAAAELRRYAHHCVQTVHDNLDHCGLPLLTIFLVQGDALGGGFEAALSSDLIVAERRSRFGLPEILFNLFPGMGAYSLLCRRLDGARARQLILSGRVYSATEMQAMGVVDELVEDGEGVAGLRRLLERDRRRHQALRSIAAVERRCQPVALAELIDVTDLWVDAALALDEADLRRMERLVSAQLRRRGAASRG